MLSKKDKVEFIKDGLSLKRRKDFSKTKNIAGPVSLDKYIRFLMAMQKVSPFPLFHKKTLTACNKL